MTTFTDPPAWSGPSEDPNDKQFGDVVEPTTIDAAGDYAAVLVGEPYDGGVIGRPGARRAPKAVRRSLASAKSHHYGSGAVGSVGDLGDVALPEAAVGDPNEEDSDVGAVQEAVAAAAERVYEAGTAPVFLGGDNSLTYANAAPLLDRGSVGAVSFDAHLDCREVTDGPTSGTPYRQLLEAGLDRLVVVGARHFETSTEYVEYAGEHDVSVRTAGSVGADPGDLATSVLSAMSGLDAVYVSVDCDVLDQAHAPGVSAPTPGGITPRELFGVVRRLLADPLVSGFEVVECSPPLDRDGRTVRVAARTVAHALAGLAGAESNPPGRPAVFEGDHE